MDEITKSLKELDKHTKKVLAQDPESILFWSKYFSGKEEAILFIKNCLKKLLNRRMMLRTEWYVGIADSMPKIRDSRPALQVIFLVSLAEGLAGARSTKRQANNLGSQKSVLDFFKYIAKSDREELMTKFRRTLTATGRQTLRFSSIIRILYQIRNDAVHGEEFWKFSLVDKKHHKDVKEPHWSLLTTGRLGTKKRKREENIETRLKYENLRDIFVRTAIQ